MPAPLLSVMGAGKSFGAAPLFSGIALHISEGERLGLIGPNGAGKSTLLKIMAGMIEPDTGARTVRKQARIGFVPQEPQFTAGMTVGRVLHEALPAQGMEDEERAAAVNIDARPRRIYRGGGAPVETLSGGMEAPPLHRPRIDPQSRSAAARRAH